MLSTLFPFVKSSPAQPVNHPAENGIDLGVVMAPRAHSSPGHLRPLIPWAVPANRVFPPKRENKLTDRIRVATLFLAFLFSFFRRAQDKFLSHPTVVRHKCGGRPGSGTPH